MKKVIEGGKAAVASLERFNGRKRRVGGGQGDAILLGQFEQQLRCQGTLQVDMMLAFGEYSQEFVY